MIAIESAMEFAINFISFVGTPEVSLVDFLYLLNILLVFYQPIVSKTFRWKNYRTKFLISIVKPLLQLFIDGATKTVNSIKFKIIWRST